MPYFISNDNPNCSGWAVEKEDGEVIGCHRTRQEAIDQMVALSIAEDIEPGGERSKNIDDRTPPEAAREEARRGLEWRREYNRGGTEVGVARARDIANGRNLSVETLKRMSSYFARHEVDKEGQGWNRDEEGYPSAGRIAWALWGGDPARTWANNLLERIENANEEKRSTSINMLSKSAKAIFEVKNDLTNENSGEVSALVSIFNNVDLVGDRVMPGAFEKSLNAIKEAGRAIPFIWSHDWGNPDSYIGKIYDAEETEEGLLVKAELFDTATAQHIRQLLASGVINEFSFAYDVIDQKEAEDGVNELLELNILEAGPTLKGANPDTQLIGVRSLDKATESKAEPGELSEGSFVTWGVEGYGRVEYIMTEGFFGVDNDPLSLEATAEDPLALVRIYDEEDGMYEPTEMFTGFRFSELTVSDEKNEKSILERTRSKVGRSLSTKNEEKIRSASTLLTEVLSSIEKGEPAKSEEPAAVKVEEQGINAELALQLIELEELA